MSTLKIPKIPKIVLLLSLLPDTAIAAVASTAEIFTYAQLRYGELAEARSKDDEYYTHTTIPGTSWNSVKLFTPLAAAFMDDKTVRYLFYLDRTNTLNNLVYEDDEWRAGDLGDRGIVTADYSKLAAVTIEGIIHVYYQSTDKNGDIRGVYGFDGNWSESPRPSGGHPLFGTSLAVVKRSCAQTPLVFFQKADLGLAVLQVDKEISALKNITQKPSPHTPLSADTVEDYIDLFYTSDDNTIQRLVFDKDEQLIDQFGLVATTPKGNIATVFWKMERTKQGYCIDLITFYQPWRDNIVTETLNDAIVFGKVKYSVGVSCGTRSMSDPVLGTVVPKPQ